MEVTNVNIKEDKLILNVKIIPLIISIIDIENLGFKSRVK
ncbi:hypothetical protein CLPUN_25420 [Clostridium puniceum]|uniref:Uncharacterized protein n=1 Tax=Clostridium puniceum TaxID=29367 RepID=A0A1S8TGW5_9CLOT|nr:hypothetical protein CLPUN_25420 [Clostridium puniceum]